MRSVTSLGRRHRLPPPLKCQPASRRSRLVRALRHLAPAARPSGHHRSSRPRTHGQAMVEARSLFDCVADVMTVVALALAQGSPVAVQFQASGIPGILERDSRGPAARFRATGRANCAMPAAFLQPTSPRRHSLLAADEQNCDQYGITLHSHPFAGHSRPARRQPSSSTLSIAATVSRMPRSELSMVGTALPPQPDMSS